MAKKADPKKKVGPKKSVAKKAAPKSAATRKGRAKKVGAVKFRAVAPRPDAVSGEVLDRLWGVVMSRRDADPASSHSARLLARGTAKIAQKFGEEAIECLIEATRGNADALVAESADVLYHLVVMWVDAGVKPDAVWQELHRREGMSGVAEKASRAHSLPMAFGTRTTKIP